MAVILFPNPSFSSASQPSMPGSAKAITASDADTFERPVHIYVGTAGAVAVTPANGQASVTFPGMAAGTILPVMVSKVSATGTTASNLVAVY